MVSYDVCTIILLFPTEARRVFHLLQYAGYGNAVVSPSTISAPSSRGSIPNCKRDPRTASLLERNLIQNIKSSYTIDIEGLLQLIRIVPNLQIYPRPVPSVQEMDLLYIILHIHMLIIVNLPLRNLYHMMR